jgi:uncharacterized protein (TIGR02722 family)
MRALRSFLILLAVAWLTSGCAAFRIGIQEKKPGETAPLTAKYDQNDLLNWAKVMSTNLTARGFPPAGVERPLVVTMGIQNRTRSHLDTKALADSIETELLNSAKLRFINAARRDDLLKEQGYQLANCPADKRVAAGKQLGARYMLTGSLVEIQQQSGREVRVARQEDVYYQLTMEATDLETGEILVRAQTDRLRRISKPLVGW